MPSRWCGRLGGAAKVDFASRYEWVGRGVPAAVVSRFRAEHPLVELTL
jgi:hypothetical protein